MSEGIIVITLAGALGIGAVASIVGVVENAVDWYHTRDALPLAIALMLLSVAAMSVAVGLLLILRYAD